MSFYFVLSRSNNSKITVSKMDRVNELDYYFFIIFIFFVITHIRTRKRNGLGGREKEGWERRGLWKGEERKIEGQLERTRQI